MQTIEKIERPKTSLHKCRVCCREYTTTSGLNRHIKDKHPEQFTNYKLPPGHPAHVANTCRKIERKQMDKDQKTKPKAKPKAKPKKTIVLVEQTPKEPKASREDIGKQLDNLSKEVKKLRANLQ